MKKSNKKSIVNRIGLDSKKCEILAEKLNVLLADYSIFYQNVRGFHWNIKGVNFFELHVKFEELYTDLQLKIDEIAERILTLGHTPTHNFSDYKSKSNIKESPKVTDGLTAINDILDNFSKLLLSQREILEFAEDANDEGTISLISDYITAQEKLVWMYSSYLK